MAGVVPFLPLIGQVFGSLTAPSPTAGLPQNMTAPGANQFYRDLQSGKGFGVGTVSPQDVGASFGTARAALSGNEARDMGQASTAAGGQAAAYGADNPFAWIQHAQGQVGNEYAGQYGQLSGMQAAAQIAQAQKNAEMDRQTRLQLIGQGQGSGSQGGSYQPGQYIPSWMKQQPNTLAAQSRQNKPYNNGPGTPGYKG